MADIIDREEVRKKLYKIKTRCEQKPKHNEYRRGQLDALEYAITAVDDCEALEATTIVCCQDCIHASERDRSLVYCGFFRKHRDPTDYCNYGEKVY